jgi:hypothetical protein
VKQTNFPQGITNVSNVNKLLLSSIVAATIAVPTFANAAKEAAKVSCGIAITTTGAARGGSYNKDFVLSSGVGFVEDFKDPIHFDSFTAALATEAGNLVVSIDYFRDVSTFDSVGLTTRLTIHNGRGIETTSGTNEFSSSLGGFRDYRTNYTLTCRRL